MSRIETIEQVQAASRGRLYPGLTHASWLILRRRRELFRAWLAALPVQDHLSVLDVGGRLQPYRSLIQTPLARYVAIDLRITPLVSVVANAECLPLADQKFDLAICTQMLEYVSDPRQALEEIHRALKPGGILLLSVPSLSLRDADQDRWRFWPAAIRQLLSSFSQVEVVNEGSSIVGFFRTLNVGLETMAKYAFLRGLIRHTAIPLLNLAGLGLESLARSHDDTFAVNYSVRARK